MSCHYACLCTWRLGAISLVALTFALGDQGSQLLFVPSPDMPPSIMQDIAGSSRGGVAGGSECARRRATATGVCFRAAGCVVDANTFRDVGDAGGR